MIRPLIVSMYDYRMTFSQQTNPIVRDSYKMHCIEACSFMGAEEIFSKMDQHSLDPEEAIRNWNAKSLEMAGQPTESNIKMDSKSKLDDIFKANNRNYYRNREPQRVISKQKSQGYRSPVRPEAFNPPPPQLKRQYSSSSGYSQARYFPPKENYYPQRFKDRY